MVKRVTMVMGLRELVCGLLQALQLSFTHFTIVTREEDQPSTSAQRRNSGGVTLSGIHGPSGRESLEAQAETEVACLDRRVENTRNRRQGRNRLAPLGPGTLGMRTSP